MDDETPMSAYTQPGIFKGFNGTWYHACRDPNAPIANEMEVVTADRRLTPANQDFKPRVQMNRGMPFVDIPEECLRGLVSLDPADTPGIEAMLGTNGVEIPKSELKQFLKDAAALLGAYAGPLAEPPAE